MLTPRHKTNAGFAVAILAFLVIGAAAYAFIDRLVGVSEAMNRLAAVNSALDGLTGRIAEAEARSRAYVLTGDPRQLALHRSTVQEIPGAMERLRAAVADDPARAALGRRLVPLVQQRVEHLASTLAARARGASAAEIARRVAEGVTLTDSILAVARLIEASRERQLGSQMAESEIHYGWAPTVILAATLGGLVIVLLAMVAVNRDLSVRERAAAALREAQERARVVLNTVVDGIIAIDDHGAIEGMNPAAEQLFGWTEAEALGRNVKMLMPEPYASEHDGYLARHLATGEARVIGQTRELLGLRHDGSTFTMELALGELRLDGRRLFTGVVRDVTERRALEAGLRASQERYRAVVEGLGEGVFVQEASGHIVEANAAAERILGMTREELVGPHVTEMPWHTLHEDGSPLPHEERPAAVCLRTGQPVRNAVIGALRPDGRLAWLLVNVRPLRYGPDGKPTAVVSSFSDISRRKEAETVVRENQARLQDFLDNAHDFIVSTGPDGRLQYVNRAWQEALGLRAVDVLGRDLFEFLDAGCAEACRAAFDRVLAGETVSDLEATFIARDGRRVTVYGSSNCRFEDGRPVAMRGVFRDITEIRRSQEAMERARDEAERANRAKSAFLANMSHELRTPLNSVIGFAGVLLKNRAGNLRAEDLEFLSRIHDNGRHLLDLINSILDLSKVEAGKVELELGPVPLDRLVEEALGLVAGQAPPGVRLRAEVPAGLPPVTGDHGKLKQVVVNLLANALKFTERGSVTVRVAADPLTGEPDYLEVRDTGIGIPADRQAAIFEAFQQADTSTARRFGGTGLGLTISRSLVQLMGYRVELESEEGRGSAFRVVFRSAPAPTRAAAPREAAAAPPERPESTDLGSGLVLVIDDDANVRQVLARQIAAMGPRTIVAGAGAEGLRLARTERPDLVTVDLLMPGMTGWDVVRAMKADPELHDIPVVVVSAVADERGGTVPGAADLLNKPVDRDALLAVLRRHLRGAAPRSRAP
jgi:two-component system sensor histidine kinase/response regulator